MVKDTHVKLGSWAFLIGIMFSIIVGIYNAAILETGGNFFLQSAGIFYAWILAIIGVIVGIFAIMGKGTITEKEIPGFLLASIALVVMGGVFQGWYTTLPQYLGTLLAGISMSLSVFVAPAVIIIAIKSIWDIGKDR